MKVSKRYYPHPVLSTFSDDIIKGHFETNLNITTSRAFYTFDVNCSLTNIDMLNYIEEKQAYYVIHIECSDTRLRQVFQSFDSHFSFEIPSDKLNGKVEVTPFILAAKDIRNYSNIEFHADYTGLTFSVVKGDVLAIDEGKTFDAVKEKDDLKHIPSIFTVGKAQDSDKIPFDVDFEQTNKIVIKLSKSNFEYYRQLAQNNETAQILSSILLLPALVSLLEQIKSSDFEYEQFEEFRWFKVIELRLKKLGIDIERKNDLPESAVAIAQKIIGDPLSGGLKALFENTVQVEE
ncbi:hypothetical protein [Priestia megaterium]|uniref:hypothetical protein n=1 Tax=Priestia megaterium TaxID=1404 RepID=UPI00203E0F76|nr:hypothetical protein [Priestia megaterium]MCM3186377.1 hypothetical protein [Priestia megaterium]